MIFLLSVIVIAGLTRNLTIKEMLKQVQHDVVLHFPKSDLGVFYHSMHRSSFGSNDFDKIHSVEKCA